MLLSPTTSRRLSSGGVPAMRRSSGGARSSFGRRGSASISSGIATGPKSATLEAVDALSTTPGPAAAPEPQTAASESDKAILEAADDANGAHTGMITPTAPASAEQPARRSKRRRLSSAAVQAAAVPAQHQQGGDVQMAEPADKPFDDEVGTLEQMQSVQCDRCGKWRVVDPNYKVRTHIEVVVSVQRFAAGCTACPDR